MSPNEVPLLGRPLQADPRILPSFPEDRAHVWNLR